MEESAVIDLKERFDGVWTADIEQKFSEKVRTFRDTFRKVRDRHYGKGDRYLEYGPSAKSVKKVCAKVKEETNRHRRLCPVDEVVERLNLVLDGWGRYFRCGYPSRQFAKVNGYVRMRLYKFLNGKSQRGYRLKYAETYYGEYQRLGLITLTKRRYYR